MACFSEGLSVPGTGIRRLNKGMLQFPAVTSSRQGCERETMEDGMGRRRSSPDILAAFQTVTDAAENFVNRTPRLKRLEVERQAVLDAIRGAQLLLSVKRLPSGTEPTSTLAQDRRPRRIVRSTHSK